ncbi:MAG: hypothetical protein HY271_01635 [Deltaproteobacteria bacterium]|nr:hypothetical protein [Deltaproteobacteria bacterium]
MRVVVDRPADRLLVDRAELLTGWIEPLAADAREPGLTATCGGRELAVRRCWHPEARRRPQVAGFWSMLMVQELLPAAPRGDLAIDLWWRGAHVETVCLRISPVAAHLARAHPLNLGDYRVPPLRAAPTPAPAPTLVFPGLGATGGASLNQLLRWKMLRDDRPLPVYFEANDPALWACARAGDPSIPSWIDGHACYAAADDLGAPFARVTLLREPAARLLSIFNYNTLVHPYDFPFRTVEAFLASDAAARCTQAASLLRCAGIDVDPTVAADELSAQAGEELRRHYALVGVTELFEETIFLLCQLGGYDTIGMWWKVLSAPGRPSAAGLSVEARRRLEELIAADRRLYDDARRALVELVATHAFAGPLAHYRADAAAQSELPDVYKLVECLRWRQILVDAELRAVRAARESR